MAECLDAGSKTFSHDKHIRHIIIRSYGEVREAEIEGRREEGERDR